jgi:hypothetical protein
MGKSKPWSQLTEEQKTRKREICRNWYHRQGKNNNTERCKKYREDNEERYLKYRWNEFNRNASKRKGSIQILKEQWHQIVRQPCYLCGFIPEGFLINGLDRVDNENGYTPENIKSCCFKCNKLKLNWEITEFLDQVKKIEAYQQYSLHFV